MEESPGPGFQPSPGNSLPARIKAPGGLWPLGPTPSPLGQSVGSFTSSLASLRQSRMPSLMSMKLPMLILKGISGEKQ